MTSPRNLAERAEKLQGLGCKRKRVEYIRFTQGRGNYVDDVKLPGMLFGDFARSSMRMRASKASIHRKLWRSPVSRRS